LKPDNFIDIPFTTKNLDVYVVRKTILNAIKENLPKFQGQLLDVGCGKMPYRKYILEHSGTQKYVGLDLDNAHIYSEEVRPDYRWDGVHMPFENNSFDCVFATEVLEHCPEPEIMLNEIHRVLKEEGILFFTTPFFWTLHEVPNDQYRYTPFSLQRHLENCGFKQIEIKAGGGWNASLAQMLGLWVNRSPLTKRRKKLFTRIIKPVIHYLLKKDEIPVQFNSSQMITTLYGTASKK
jgi:SAM-dependent methyltransferase